MGRVEVCINEQYGTVCDQGFERNSAAVVCGQLGYSRISKFTLSIAGADSGDPSLLGSFEPPFLKLTTHRAYRQGRI